MFDIQSKRRGTLMRVVAIVLTAMISACCCIPQAPSVPESHKRFGRLIVVKFKANVVDYPGAPYVVGAEKTMRGNCPASPQQEFGSCAEAWQGISKRFGELTLHPMFSPQTLRGLQQTVKDVQAKGPYLDPNFQRLFFIALPPDTRNDREVLRAIRRLTGAVESAYIDRAAPLPGTVTRDKDTGAYVNAAPVGLGIDLPSANAAWKLASGTGQRIGIMERSWIFNAGATNTDLPTLPSTVSAAPGAFPELVFGDPCTLGTIGTATVCLATVSERIHGSATIGLVVAKQNGQDIVGIAPDADLVLASSVTGRKPGTNFPIENKHDAIATLMLRLRAGDVMLIESQSQLVNDDGTTDDDAPLVPVEQVGSIFELLGLAVRTGVTVVEPAGNYQCPVDAGACDPAPLLNLDAVRVFGDVQGKPSGVPLGSGAIIVGAANPSNPVNGALRRLPYVNSGSVVKVYGWGKEVVSTTVDQTGLSETTPAVRIGMTSSASAMVAGAALLVQAIKQDPVTKAYLTPAQVLDWLADAKRGTPVADDVATSTIVGSMPDLARIVP